MNYVVISIISGLFFSTFLTNALELVKINELKIIQRCNDVPTIVNGEFRCPIENCGASYNKLASLYAHRIRQHTDYAYPCPWCINRIYGLSDSRLRHVKSHHNKEYEELLSSGKRLERLSIPQILPRPKRTKLDNKQEEQIISSQAIDTAEPITVKTEIKRERSAKIKALQFIKRCVYELNYNEKYESKRLYKKAKIKKESSNLYNEPVDVLMVNTSLQEQSYNNYMIEPEDFDLIITLQKQNEEEQSIIAQQKELELYYDSTLRNADPYPCIY